MRAVLPSCLSLVLIACGAEPPELVATDRPLYVTLDDDLAQLRTDFNAMSDKLRLVFISGPSCGICLRGLDDLNRAAVAELQDDPRVHTLVLHVPTLDAEEHHARASIPLMYGPRVNHYWDPSGHSGLEFQQALGLDIYAWDVWMIYPAGDEWLASQPPPAPEYWEHQLGPLPRETRLDAERFARAIHDLLDTMPPATEEARQVAVQTLDAGLMKVMQPRGFMIQQNHASRGGYAALKGIESIHYEGKTKTGTGEFDLMVETARPNYYRRVVADDASQASVEAKDGEVQATDILPGWSQDLQREWPGSYEFDGWMTDFKDKGHQLRRLGMKQHANRLPWIMEAELANGRTWHLYIDSHTGDLYRQALVDGKGKETIALEFEDFRDATGFRLPHVIRYYDGAELLATDRFDSITVHSRHDAFARSAP